MNRARDQLLARPALAGDEDGRPARRRLDDQIEDLLHLRALADDPGEAVIAGLEILLERDVLGYEAPPLDGVAQHDEHFVVLERLGNVVERAALHRRNRVLHRGVRGDHDHRQLFVLLPQLLEHGQSVHARHHHVDDDRIEGQGAGEFQTLGAARRQAHVVPLTRQERLENLPHDLLVIDDED